METEPNGCFDILHAGHVTYLEKAKKVNKNVDAIVVPGSGLVKLQAEKEGLDKIFNSSIGARAYKNLINFNILNGSIGF